MYDALVSINVPNDKARAVVDAMERDMATSLATKTDLDSLRAEIRSEIAALRKDMESQGATLRKNMQSQGAELRLDIALLRKDMEAQVAQIVIRLGALIVVVAGLMLGAMQLSA